MAANPPNTRGEFDGDDELAEIWRTVENRVQKLAQDNNLQTTPGRLNIDEMTKVLEGAMGNQMKQSEEYGKLIDSAGNAMKWVEVCAGFLGGGGTLGLPVSTCFNAVNFVVQKWQNCRNFAEHMAALLERCSRFFSRLGEYKGFIDDKLKVVAVRYLELFVDICSKCVTLRQDKGWFKNLVMVVSFTEDPEINTYLTKMDDLKDWEQGLVQAKIFNSVKNTQAMLQTSIEYQKEHEERKADRRWRKTIAKTLGFEPADLDTESEPVAKWRTKFNNIKNTSIEGTGSWIMKDPHDIFTRWAAETSTVSPILVLNGESGSGKTFMTANVIKNLHKVNGISPKIFSAYFFVKTDSKRGEKPKKRLQKLSRSLLWQCTTASESMTRCVGKLCDANNEFDDMVDMWSQLFLENDKRKKSSKVYYIFIDGLRDDIMPIVPLLQRLGRDELQRKVRVFITSTPKALQRLKTAKVSFNVINISSDNADDVAKYITHRMDQMDTLSDTTRSEVCKWRERTLTELKNNCGGDYFKLVTSLNKIEKVDLADDINEVLANAGKARSDHIVEEMQELNRARTSNEVIEINEIIMWIQHAQKWLTVKEMEAVLAIKRNLTSSSAITSLLSFQSKLKDKYSIFEVDVSGIVKFRSVEIDTYFDDLKASSLTSSSEGATKETALQWRAGATADDKFVSEAELNIVEHYLKSVCPPELYERFEFDQIIASKQKPELPDHTIWYDPPSADMGIILSSLKVLTEPENERTSAICDYAAAHLLTHLKNAKLKDADKKLKSEVGPLLVKLFTEDRGIDAMFWVTENQVSLQTWNAQEGSFLRRRRMDWLYSNNGAQVLVEWLKDIDVVENISSKTSEGVFVKALTKPGTDLRQELLKPAAVRLAKRLLQNESWRRKEIQTGLSFLIGFVNQVLVAENTPKDAKPKQATKQQTDAIRQDNGPLSEKAVCKMEEGDFTKGEVDKIEHWARKALADDAEIDEALWELQMAWLLANKCSTSGSKELAEKRARKAHKTNPENWLACYYTAMITSNNDDGIDRSLHCIGLLEQRISNRQAQKQPEQVDYESPLARSHMVLGFRYWRRNEFNMAVKHHLKSFDYKGTLFGEYMEAIELYKEQARGMSIIQLLERMLESIDKWPAYFDGLYHDMLASSEFGNIVADAARDQDRWDVVERLYQHAAEIAGSKEAWDTKFLLHKQLGDLLYQRGAHLEVSEASWAASIQVWTDHHYEKITPNHVVEIAENLSRIYLEQARKHPPGSIAGGGVVAEFAAKLLDKILQLHVPGQSPLTNRIVSCCAARHHIRTGREADAKKLVQEIVRGVTDMFKDDDVSHKIWAMMCLANVTSTFADAKNTVAAWYFVNQVQSERGPDKLIKCSGCGGWCEYVTDGRICCDCVGLAFFHSKCVQKTTMNGCHKDHTFLDVPMWYAGKVKTGFLRVEGREVKFEDWIGRLEKKYLSL